MANLNKVMLIGRLTRDPEVRTFASGGKVAKLGFAVNNRKKDAQTGQWVDDPVFLDLEVFNRGEQGRQADIAAESFRKGHQAFIEGHLRLDQWLDKDGQKRSKLVVVVDNFQFLERREDGQGGGGGMRSTAPARTPARSGAPSSGGDEYEEPDNASHGGQEEEIPF
jgi:single-strand DNA-binding protein